MRFYNRKKELDVFQQIIKRSGFNLIVVYGRRRIGKTRLIREFLKNKNYSYVFVPKDKTPDLFLEDVSKSLNIPRFKRIRDMIQYLFETKKYIFFDEFQNFYHMDKSVYSDFQEIIDEMKMTENDTNVFISGSSFSLIKKIFSDYAHPLYNRADIMIKLQPFDFKTIKQILHDTNIKDKEQIILYSSVFGGIPKYYELLETIRDKGFENTMKFLFFDKRIPILKEEGKAVLISEFGGDYKIYFSVLEAIAIGKTTISEIADVFQGKNSTVSRYVDILRNEYELLKRDTPILEDPRKSRSGIYRIKDNFLGFWFLFVKRYEAYYEQERTDELYLIFLKEYNSFIGLVFEEFSKEFISMTSKIYKTPFVFGKIGRQWGKFKGPKGKNTYEIDIVALNEDTKDILFVECKWKDLSVKQAEDILRKLKEKSEYVDWNLGKRNEYFGLVAKKIEGKDELRTKGFVVFDLDDF